MTKAYLSIILGLMLVLSVYSTAQSFADESKDQTKEDRKEAKDKAKEEKKEAKDKRKEEAKQAKDKEKEERKEAKDNRKEERKEYKDKTKGKSGYTDDFEKYLNELQHRTSRLQKIAEEQDNREALAALEHVIDLIRQAKQMLSEENYEQAKALLREANNILNKVEMMLHGGTSTIPPSDVNFADMINKFVAELEHRASRLQKAAEEQGNNEALSLIQQAMDLITKAKQMISEESYDEAKPLLRDANELLNKAEMILTGGSYAKPIPGEEGQEPYYPPHPAANNKPNVHPISSLVGVGIANEDGEEVDVFAELELSVFRATPNMMLLRVTDGTITVGDAVYTLEQGKVVMVMKAHKMIVIAKLSNDDTVETHKLRLFGSMPNSPPDDIDNTQSDMNTIMLRGKLAKMSIKMDAELI